jgi:multicomponent Na+:H+ antiporter subunit D
MNWLELLTLHSPALIVAVPLLAAFLTPLVSKINDTVRNLFVFIMLSITGLLVAILSYDVFTNGIRLYVFGGGAPLPSGMTIPVRIMFEVDAMNIFMIIITMALAFISIIYSWSYLKNQDGLDKYYTIILLLITSMLGIELTGDIFNFFGFLEISCITSCALIAFYINKKEAVEAAFNYIVISSIGALFILFAIGLLYAQYSALNMATLASSIQFTFLDKITLVLLITGLAMKAGIVPMHMWLPDAYGRAPASVTIILIGATMASFYALLRVTFTIYGNSLTATLNKIGDVNITLNGLLGAFVLVLAVATIVVGVLMALKQTNLKKMIAFAALAEIGYMFLAIGAWLVALNDPNLAGAGFNALKGGIFHIINDVLDIGLLFLVAGAIYYATKETSLNMMGGLARNMKYTTVFFIIGLLAVSGMPPMNGFASKLLIYESIFLINPILAIVAILGSILLLAVFVKVLHSAFLGPQIPQFKEVKEVPKSMLAAMGIITCAIIIFGLFPDLIVNNLVQPAAEALSNNSNYITSVLGGGA